MNFLGMAAIPALALGSVWCRSLQLPGHPSCSRVCSGDPKLVKSYPQETISKTDGPVDRKITLG